MNKLSRVIAVDDAANGERSTTDMQMENPHQDHIRNPRPSDPSAISIYLVDNNQFFRYGMRMALAEYGDIQVVGESSTNLEAFTAIATANPQIVVIEIDSPDFFGLRLTRQLASHLPEVMIIVLSQHLTDDELLQATAAGACAYEGKDIGPAELADLIRQVAEAQLPITQNLIENTSVLKDLLNHFRELAFTGRATCLADGTLTIREAEVLSYVACGYGNKQVASKLGITEQTIKNHMSAIMNKMKATDRTHAVVMAMERGWISASLKTTSPETLV